MNEEMEQANLNLKQVNDAGFQPHAFKINDLESFFEQSLRRDNFDGLAHLASYLETNNTNI